MPGAQGAVYLHHLPLLEAQLGLPRATLWAEQHTHILTSIAVLAVPGALAAALHYVGSPIIDQLTAPAPAPAPMPATAGAGAGGGAPSSTTAPALTKRIRRAPPPDFLNLSYGYLPLVWGATLAHYEAPFMEEAGRVLPVAAVTFGMAPDVASVLPTLTAHPAVVEFVMGSTLLATSALSLMLTRRLGNSWVSVLPQCVGISVLLGELWHVIM